VFVDVGIGGDTAARLARSPVYADVGATLRARVTYQDIPADLRVSAAWPVGAGRSWTPRVSGGIGWAF
jgi:hypothetical protein